MGENPVALRAHVSKLDKILRGVGKGDFVGDYNGGQWP